MKKLALIAVLTAVLGIAPAAAASPTVRLTIMHVVEGCHVWGTNDSQPLGPKRTLKLVRGSKLVIRDNCTMTFEFSQVAGPMLKLGNTLTYPGTTRTIVFRQAGLYRLKAVNVQSSEEMGLQTFGPDNQPLLIVRVR